MGYFPSHTFSLNAGEDFVFTDEDYSPQSSFALKHPPLTFTITPPETSTRGIQPYLFLSTYTPANSFYFTKILSFRFSGVNYQPSTVFAFPAHFVSTDTPIIPITIEGIINGTLMGLIGAITGNYDPNVNRLQFKKTNANATNATYQANQTKISYQQTTATPVKNQSIQQAATQSITKNAIISEATHAISQTTCTDEQATTPTNHAINTPLNTLTLTALKKCGTQDQATPKDNRTCAQFDLLTFTTQKSSHTIDDASKYHHHIIFYHYDYDIPGDNYQPSYTVTINTLPEYDDSRTLLPVKQPVNFTFAPINYTPSTLFDSFLPSANPVINRPGKINQTINYAWKGAVSIHQKSQNWQTKGIRGETDTHFSSATQKPVITCSDQQNTRQVPKGISEWIDYPRPPVVTPPGHTQTIIPKRESYFMQHTLSATLLDLTPINLSTISVSLDAEAYSWKFNGALADKDQISLLKQTTADPVQLIITINGYTWIVIVEKTSRSRQFGKNIINISGRSISALLGAPYYIASSASQGSDLTVQQIADLQLPVGWTNNWTAATWLINGGAYSHQNRTPIQAIADIARNIGAMVVPSSDSQVLNIKPRYPILPWDFAAAIPDIIIPPSVITALTERPVVPHVINGIYVHGEEIGGEIGWCRLSGSAGDKLASTQSNALMTDAAGLRALGERLLAAQYDQPAIQSMTLPMDGTDVPMINLGDLIETTLDGTAIRGIVNAISITASFNKVRQTIQIGEETTNNWALFKDLLPADPQLIATLSSTDGATSLMSLIDGGVVRVRGTGVVNNKYYIRSGKIDGDAPNMTQNDIVI